MNKVINYSSYQTKKRYNVLANLNVFFYLGLIFIPFDNLFFAPSSGWATIAPFFFLFYILFNLNNQCFKFTKDKVTITFIFICLVILPGMVQGLFSEFIDSLGTLILGISFYFSLQIYSKSNPKRFKKNIFKILFIVYFFAYIYGIVSLIPSSGINNFFNLIEKRHYGNRLQFTFTEPSFISMHLYGVIFPFALFFKDKKMKILGFLFLITTLIFGDSARFYLDTIVAIGAFLLYKVSRYGLKYLFVFLLISILAGFICYQIIINFAPRILSIFENGIYSDNSLAARWFRINAIINGFDFKGLIFGYGLSNTWIPFNKGYYVAYSQYLNGYTVEIDALLNTRGSSFFCMPLRILSEGGLCYFLFVIMKMRSKKYWQYLLLIVWLYLQFDSYAFYAIWVYLFLIKERKI